MTHETPRNIEAIIPSTEQPPRILVHTETGALPIIEHRPEYGTHEGTLHTLARIVTGMSLSVDRGLVSGDPNVTRYQTEPIPSDTPVDPTFKWEARQ